MATEGKDSCYSWLIAASAFTLLTVHGGMVYSIGVMIILLRNSIEATETKLALATSLNIGMLYAVGPIGGYLTNKFNERSVSAFGVLLASAGLALSHFSTQMGHLYLTYSIMSGVGLGLTYGPAVTILNRYFDKWKLIALGLANSGIGLGSFIFPPLMNLFEETLGWRGTFVMLAGINLQSLVACALLRPFKGKQPIITIITDNEMDRGTNNNLLADETLLSRDNKDCILDKTNSHGIQSNTLNRQSKPNRVFGFVKKLSDTRYICLCLHAMVKYFPVMMFHTYFGTFAMSIGFDQMEITKLYMTMALCDMISRPFVGIITKVTGINKFIICGAAAIGNGILTGVLPFLRERILLYVLAALSGIFFCSYNVLCVTLVADSVPVTAIEVGFGFATMACVPGTIFGAPIAAFIYECTSIYSYIFYVAGGLFILSGFLLIPSFPIFNHKTENVEIVIEST